MRLVNWALSRIPLAAREMRCARALPRHGDAPFASLFFLVSCSTHLSGLAQFIVLYRTLTLHNTLYWIIHEEFILIKISREDFTQVTLVIQLLRFMWNIIREIKLREFHTKIIQPVYIREGFTRGYMIDLFTIVYAKFHMVMRIYMTTYIHI